MRLSLIAITGLGIIAFASVTSAIEPEQPAKDGELRKLMVQRYKAAWEIMEARTALYPPSRVPIDHVCEAIERFSSAGLQAAKTRAYRLILCEYAFERAKTIEAHVKDKYDHEVEPIQSLKLATYTRLDMEIKLREALKAEGADKTGTDSSRSNLDDSDLPSLGAPDGK